LTARGTDKEILEKSIADNVASLTQIIGDIIVGFDEDDTIEVVLGRLLTQQKKTIATAESCTGGKIAQMLSSVPGASNYFKGSVVSYATETKIKVLGISEALIQKHSVVSAEVAKAMAFQFKSYCKPITPLQQQEMPDQPKAMLMLKSELFLLR
jgi:nicotinamide-nucleotide amidase